MRGIILAGGHGTRLRPATYVINKHLIPILNKPMILYPLDTLKKLGITEVLIVTGGNHLGMFAEFLGDGSEYGVSLTYRIQESAGGIAQALGLAENFAQGGKVAVILGDNIFDDQVVEEIEISKDNIAQIFTKNMPDPSRFGVVRLKKDGERLTNIVEEIIEKPKEFVSYMAVTGLYIYPGDVFDVVKDLKPSARGELEITDVNNFYVRDGRIECGLVNGFWSDAGTPESLAEVTKWAYGKIQR